ncbi:MAG: hypothetical protein DRQ88_09060 [Epsilonproteobacteria bacterium]|nr:MAG: hypothetical protein DRQ88_09060 [Campylobacterota bacterium]
MKIFSMHRFGLLFLFFIFSCGPTSELEMEDDVYKALNHLSNKECQESIDTLSKHSNERANVLVMETLASSYACRANYNTPDFITTDVPLIGDPLVLGGFTRFTNAGSMDSPTNDGYTDMYTAIQTLLFTGGIPLNKDPTLERRNSAMNDSQVDKINSFLGHTLMEEMGRYLYYYGNSSDTGVKGSGIQVPPNPCIVNYTDISFRNPIEGHNSIKKYLKGVKPGSCDDISGFSGMFGHPRLGDDASGFYTERLCQGVILFNNFYIVMPQVLSKTSTATTFDTVSDIMDALDQAKENLEEALPLGSTLNDILNLENCYKEYKSDSDSLQIYFTLIYETLFL